MRRGASWCRSCSRPRALCSRASCSEVAEVKWDPTGSDRGAPWRPGVGPSASPRKSRGERNRKHHHVCGCDVRNLSSETVSNPTNKKERDTVRPAWLPERLRLLPAAAAARCAACRSRPCVAPSRVRRCRRVQPWAAHHLPRVSAGHLLARERRHPAAAAAAATSWQAALARARRSVAAHAPGNRREAALPSRQGEVAAARAPAHGSNATPRGSLRCRRRCCSR